MVVIIGKISLVRPVGTYFPNNDHSYIHYPLLTLLHTCIIYQNATAKTDTVTWFMSQHCIELARILTFGYLLLLW